jgi:hypothetical protein
VLFTDDLFVKQRPVDPARRLRRSRAHPIIAGIPVTGPARGRQHIAAARRDVFRPIIGIFDLQLMFCSFGRVDRSGAT